MQNAGGVRCRRPRLVTLARQGNERENQIISNQTSLVDRFNTGTLRHASTAGLEYAYEEQFAPTLGGVGTRAPGQHLHAEPERSGHRLRRRSERAPSPRAGRTRWPVYAFDTVDFGRSRWQVTGGLRFEHYDTEFRAVDATQVDDDESGRQDGLVSGKAGHRLQGRSQRQRLSSRTAHRDAAGHGQLHAQRAGQQPEQSRTSKPQESTNLEVGSKWDFAGGRLLADRRGVPHQEQERHLHGRRDRGAADLQPGRRAARRRRDARRARAASRDNWQVLGELRVSRHRSRSRRARQQRQPPDADAGVLRQPLDHLPPAGAADGRRRRAGDRRGVHQRREHDQGARLSPRRRAGRVRGQHAPQPAA